MGSFAELYSQIQRAVGATERIREILREPTEAVDCSLHATERAVGAATP
ncbi:MAG: hypothetical protein RML35_06115 [Chloroherpetonaceae bacterium]|nr:hypothetical protein [Chloroherpetonaceae bacterium]